MKKILIVYYSQFGQTRTMINRFVNGFSCEKTEFQIVEVTPDRPYPTPWKIQKFFNTFPPSVNGCQIPLSQLDQIDITAEFDLIILGGQIWFLSPSIPMWNIIHHDSIKGLIKDKPILCLYSARNMWIQGVKKNSKVLKKHGATIVKNFILTDTSPSWATFVTTPRWMLTGKKEKFLFFPEAGIKPLEFNRIDHLSQELKNNDLLLKNLSVSQYSHLEKVTDHIMENIGFLVFLFWAKIIKFLSKENTPVFRLLLVLFRINLIVLIVILSILIGFFNLLFGPLIKDQLVATQKQLIEGDNVKMT